MKIYKNGNLDNENLENWKFEIMEIWKQAGAELCQAQDSLS